MGSMSVTKIIQNASCRPRKVKYTMAKAESMEMAIFPTATAQATMAEFQSRRPMRDRCHASV